MYYCFIGQNYPAGIPKNDLPNIKIQEQTASFYQFKTISKLLKQSGF